MKTKSFTIPLNWTIGIKKPKKFFLGMNFYRNAHFQVSNQVKKMLSEYCLQYNFGKHEKIRVHYGVYFENMRKRDIMNAVAVVDKFVMDHLVTVGAIPEDDFKHVSSYRIDYIGKADINKVEIIIEDI